MAKQEVFTCDVCAAVKREANHWMVAYPQTVEGKDGGRVFVNGNALLNGLTVATWADYDWFRERVPNATHLCGIECLLRHVSKWAGKTDE